MEKCPKCGSEYVYEDANMYVCPECAHEWVKGSAEHAREESVVVRDAHGNVLQDGDSVTIIKDIKVKGSATPLKVGTKVKEIRLVDEVNGHNIEANIKGFGSMMLKSEIVKKSN